MLEIVIGQHLGKEEKMLCGVMQQDMYLGHTTGLLHIQGDDYVVVILHEWFYFLFAPLPELLRFSLVDCTVYIVP